MTHEVPASHDEAQTAGEKKEDRRMPPCETCGHGWALHVIPGGVENIDIYPHIRECVDCCCRNYEGGVHGRAVLLATAGESRTRTCAELKVKRPDMRPDYDGPMGAHWLIHDLSEVVRDLLRAK